LGYKARRLIGEAKSEKLKRNRMDATRCNTWVFNSGCTPGQKQGGWNRIEAPGRRKGGKKGRKKRKEPEKLHPKGPEKKRRKEGDLGDIHHWFGALGRSSQVD